jgi:hypothetical protein
MRIGRRRKPAPEPEEPRGVRIRHADGRVTECAIVRDPEDSPDGLTQWVAVPPPGTVFTPGTDKLTADLFPGRSKLTIRADLPDGLQPG